MSTTAAAGIMGRHYNNFYSFYSSSHSTSASDRMGRWARRV